MHRVCAISSTCLSVACQHGGRRSPCPRRASASLAILSSKGLSAVALTALAGGAAASLAITATAASAKAPVPPSAHPSRRTDERRRVVAASADAAWEGLRRRSRVAALLRCDPERRIRDEFHLSVPLGEGLHGQVVLGVHRQTGQEYAVKVIALPGASSEAKIEGQIAQEVSILRQLGQHRHVVGYVDCFCDLSAVYIVMERCRGDMLDWIVGLSERGLQPGEALVARLLRQMLGVILHCHEQGILYQDVKLEHFALELGTDPENPQLKLIDFSLSERLGSLSGRAAGTAPFLAPEVDQHGAKTTASDVSGLGVALYILLTGGLLPDFTDAREMSEDSLRCLCGWGDPVDSLESVGELPIDSLESIGGPVK